MDQLFPLSEDAESQQHAQEILYIHCAHKGMQVGSILGLTLGSILLFTPARRPFMVRRLSNLGAAIGPFASMGLCFGKMRGKEEIEWKDRSWRLQRNVTQLTVDRSSEGALAASLLFARNVTGISVATATVAAGAWNWYNANVQNK